MPQSSNFKVSHAVAQTASTTMSVLGEIFLTTLETASTSVKTPDEVSVCVMVMTSYAVAASFDSSCLKSTEAPNSGASKTSTLSE